MSDPSERIEANADTDYEPADWPVGAVGLALGSVLVLLVVAVLALRLGFSNAVSDPDRSLATAMPEPRLQTDSAADLAQLRARQEKALNSYYWIDREKGIVHTPIEEAMKQVVVRGLDGFPRGER